MSAVVFAHNSQSLLIACSRLDATQCRAYAALSLYSFSCSIETAIAQVHLVAPCGTYVEVMLLCSK